MKARYLTYVACCLTFLGWAGCSRDGSLTLVELLPPSGNDIIISETVLGSENSKSWFDQVVLDGADGYYFCGVMDDKEVVGRISYNGDVMWQRDVGLYPRSILKTAFQSGSLENALITQTQPGGIHGDNRVVTIFSPSGDRLLEYQLESQGAGSWWNDIALVDATGETHEYMAVGGVKQGGRNRPYAIVFMVSADSISVVSDSVYADDVGFTFAAISDKENSPDNFYYTVINEWRDGSVWDAAIIALDRELSVNWRTPVTVSGLNRPWIRDVTSDGGHAYAVGSALTPGEERVREIAISIALSGSGDVLWTEKTSLAFPHNEYWSCTFDGTNVFAVGKAPYYSVKPTRRTYGYGWVSKIDPLSGSVLSNTTVGISDGQSGFYSAVIDNNIISCVGVTNSYVTGYSLQAWMVTFELADL
jgi:hypothetical protein